MNEKRIAEERELNALLGNPYDGCAISGCNHGDIDERGPIIMKDGMRYKMCSQHWEPIIMVLGQQEEVVLGQQACPACGSKDPSVREYISAGKPDSPYYRCGEWWHGDTEVTEDDVNESHMALWRQRIEAVSVREEHQWKVEWKEVDHG